MSKIAYFFRSVTFFSILSFIFFMLLPFTAKAGGVSYLFEIINFASTGNNQYKLTLKCKENEGECSKTNRIIIHLRFNKSAFGKNAPRQISSESYFSCISKLKQQHKAGGLFRFGFVGTGIVPIRGKKDEYQSNALAELEEHDGRFVIYSFARPL